MLLGFKKRFAEPIQKGTKVFTLRKKRKKEPKMGETLYMYTALRTSNCEKISDKEKLMSKQKVRLLIIRISNYLEIRITVDGRKLSEFEISEFVKFDGFIDRKDFADYWFENSTKEEKQKNKARLAKGAPARIGGFLNQYHWTDLKY